MNHGAVDPVDFLVVIGVCDIGQHGAPHHDRQVEAMVYVHARHRDGRAEVRHAGNDAVVRCCLRGDLHTHVRFALIVERNQLVLIFGLRVRIAQAHGEVRGVAAA
jgi:hypothetical protein